MSTRVWLLGARSVWDGVREGNWPIPVLYAACLRHRAFPVLCVNTVSFFMQSKLVKLIYYYTNSNALPCRSTTSLYSPKPRLGRPFAQRHF